MGAQGLGKHRGEHPTQVVMDVEGALGRDDISQDSRRTKRGLGRGSFLAKDQASTTA